MSFINVLNVVLPIFVVMIVGYFMARFKKLDVSSVIDIVFYIGLPCLAFVSIMNQKIVLLDAARIWGAALIAIFGGGAVAWVVFKILRQKHSGVYNTILFANTLYVPFPIISLAYGAPGLFAATLYYIPCVICQYTLGIFIASGKKGWRENLKTVFTLPTLYAAILALILNLSGVSLPELVVRPLTFIGSMVTPVLVLTLGYNLAKVKMTAAPTSLLASFIRMGVGLGLGLFAVWLFDLQGVLRAVVILDSAMPAAVNNFMLSQKYGNEPELVASIVFLTTVASLAVIPLLLYYIGPV